jgi:hypothetical protein
MRKLVPIGSGGCGDLLKVGVKVYLAKPKGINSPFGSVQKGE